jgi:VIT1/CCC1 family predicted Fe2+/Mn2+ transporter
LLVVFVFGETIEEGVVVVVVVVVVVCFIVVFSATRDEGWVVFCIPFGDG